MKLPAVDWRTARQHLDWNLLKERSRWPWVAAAALTLLSFLGAWTVTWNSAIYVGSAYSDYAYTAYNGASGENAFSTGAFVLPTVLLAVALGLASLKPYADEPTWLPWVPWALLGGMGVVLGYWLVRAMVDANDLIEGYSGTNTSFPGGVGLFLVATIVFGFGARSINRARQRESGVAVTTTLDK